MPKYVSGVRMLHILRNKKLSFHYVYFVFKDLPSLKFWSSPASVIESYLQRQLFQKRLQMAYEFNQSKETDEIAKHEAFDQSADQLAKAVNQLTNDISYFNNLAQQPLSNEPIIAEECDDRNKELWDEIYPRKTLTPPSDNSEDIDKKKVSAKEIKSKIQVHNKIKNIISDYKDFYRLKSLGSYNKPPLAVTIDKSHHISRDDSSEKDSYYETMYQDEIRENVQGITKDQMDPKKPFRIDHLEIEFSENNSEEYENSIDYSSELPSIKSVSEHNLQGTETKQKSLKKEQSEYSYFDGILPQIHSKGFNKTNLNRRETLLTVRDSVELAHKRITSTAYGYNVPGNQLEHHSLKKQTSDYKNPYRMLTYKLPNVHSEPSVYNSENSIETHLANHKIPMSKTKTITSHRDSLLLVSQKSSLKVKGNEDLNCDICKNQDPKSIQFLCDYHASFIASNQQRFHSIITKSMSCQSYRDSVVIAKRRLSLKDNKKSVACQVEDIHNVDEVQQLKDGVMKGRKMGKQNDESAGNFPTTKSPSNLKTYLMGAVHINQVQ